MTPAQYVWAKFAVAAVVVVGMFALVLAGKIDVSTMMTLTVALVSALVVALGITGAGAQVALGRTEAARLTMGMPPPRPSTPPAPGLRRTVEATDRVLR
jgi:ribose/xylose/arabinose/galactoside ABC-type transport system permease subunit